MLTNVFWRLVRICCLSQFTCNRESNKRLESGCRAAFWATGRWILLMHVTYCAVEMQAVLRGHVDFERQTRTAPFLNVFVEGSCTCVEAVKHTHLSCVVQLRLRRTQAGPYWFPIKWSVCFFSIRRVPISGGLMCLRALQLSSYSWIEVIIYLLECCINVLSVWHSLSFPWGLCGFWFFGVCFNAVQIPQKLEGSIHFWGKCHWPTFWHCYFFLVLFLMRS